MKPKSGVETVERRFASSGVIVAAISNLELDVSGGDLYGIGTKGSRSLFVL